MLNKIREMVSESRNRYRKDGFDLDLTYISKRIVAMGFPSDGIEGQYRNHIDHVVSMLKKYHDGHFLIINVSERDYDTEKFDKRVLHAPFPDHYAPTMVKVWKICIAMREWLRKNPENVCFVHCKAGKGRTGVVISCFMLMYPELANVNITSPSSRKDASLPPRISAQRCLDFFASKRGQGVTYMGQKKYVEYVARVCSNIRDVSPLPLSLDIPIHDRDFATRFARSHSRKLVLKVLKIHGIPNWDMKGGYRPSVQVFIHETEYRASEGSPFRVLANSAWDLRGEIPKRKKGLRRWSSGTLGTGPPVIDFLLPSYNRVTASGAVFPLDTIVQGDIVVKVVHGVSADQVFRFVFHTNFVETDKARKIIDEEDDDDGVEGDRERTFTLRLYKRDVDIHSREKNADYIPSDFFVDVSFESIVVTEDAKLPVASRRSPNLVGWLVKEGGFIPTWKRRWFVLNNGRLAYFKSKTDSAPKGVILFARDGRTDVSIVESSVTVQDRPFCIKIQDRKRIYVLQCPNEKECAKWTAALRRSIRRSSGGGGDGLVDDDGDDIIVSKVGK